MYERTGAIARTLLLVSQPQVAPVAMKLWLEITKNHLKNPSKEIAKTQNVTTLIHNFLLRKSNLLDQQEATVTLPVPCLQRFRRRFHPLPLKGSAYPWWFANTIQLITDRKKSTKSNLEAFYLNLAFRGIADACWQSTNYPRVFRTFAEIQMECQHIASGGATGHAWPTKQHNIRVRGLQTWEILALHLVIYIFIYISQWLAWERGSCSRQHDWSCCEILSNLTQGIQQDKACLEVQRPQLILNAMTRTTKHF